MVSTLTTLTSSIGRLQIGSQIQPQTLSVLVSKFDCRILQNDSSTQVNNVVPCRGRRMHFQGFRRHWPEFYHYMREDRHENALAYRIKKTRARRFMGHIDIYDKQGNREALKPAVERFKRLDGTGAYINVVIGRANKFYQKTDKQKWNAEQHVFTWFRFE